MAKYKVTIQQLTPKEDSDRYDRYDEEVRLLQIIEGDSSIVPAIMTTVLDYLVETPANLPPPQIERSVEPSREVAAVPEPVNEAAERPVKKGKY